MLRTTGSNMATNGRHHKRKGPGLGGQTQAECAPTCRAADQGRLLRLLRAGLKTNFASETAHHHGLVERRQTLHKLQQLAAHSNTLRCAGERGRHSLLQLPRSGGCSLAGLQDLAPEGHRHFSWRGQQGPWFRCGPPQQVGVRAAEGPWIRCGPPQQVGVHLCLPCHHLASCAAIALPPLLQSSCFSCSHPASPCCDLSILPSPGLLCSHQRCLPHCNQAASAAAARPPPATTPQPRCHPASLATTLPPPRLHTHLCSQPAGLRFCSYAVCNGVACCTLH